MRGPTEVECQVCGNPSHNRTIVVEEMMIGLRDRFEYLECNSCGCVQRLASVADPSAYYSTKNYYSFRTSDNKLLNLAHKLRARAHFGRSLFSRWIASLRPRADLAAVTHLNPAKAWRILDVGCGAGKLLRELNALGFQYLRGVDPFLNGETEFGDVRIVNCDLRDLREDGWDLIMFHHSLEHISSQREVLRAAAARLRPGGICLVRVPVIGWAWRHYRENWVQLDAPRHSFLHTERSFLSMASESGLGLQTAYYDSEDFQFWGSELYRRGIPLSKAGGPRRHFSRRTLRCYKSWAARLNRERAGDQAVFVLTREA